MPFIYSNVKGRGMIDFLTADAVKYYVRHWENALILQHIFRTATNKEEKTQANAEIRIADRKMAFWIRHRNFDPLEAARQCSKIRLENANKHEDIP